MNDKKPLRSFRPWEENQERLAFAERVGLNVSEVINEVLKLSLKKHLEAKLKAIREAASAPVP